MQGFPCLIRHYENIPSVGDHNSSPWLPNTVISGAECLPRGDAHPNLLFSSDELSPLWLKT